MTLDRVFQCSTVPHEHTTVPDHLNSDGRFDHNSRAAASICLLYPLDQGRHGHDPHAATSVSTWGRFTVPARRSHTSRLSPVAAAGEAGTRSSVGPGSPLTHHRREQVESAVDDPTLYGASGMNEADTCRKYVTMSHSGDTIKSEEITEALERSGYLLEVRVSQLLESRSWQTVPNYAYTDQVTGVTRELDILASFRCSLTDDAGGNLGYVEAVLLAECVNNPQPFAVFERPSEFANVDVHALRTAGNLTFFFEGDIWQNTLAAAGAVDWHHCCGKPGSSQFCSFRRKTKQKDAPWMASHDDSHFQVFESLHKALQHVRQYRVDAIRSGSVGSGVRLSLFYPALILQSNLIKVASSNNKLAVKEISRTLYRRGVVEDGMNNVLFIDILVENELESYCAMIQEETFTLAKYLVANPLAVNRTLANLSVELAQHIEARKAAIEEGAPPPPWPVWAQ